MNDTEITSDELDELLGQGDEDSTKRQRSAIQFPYYDLSEAEQVAGAAWKVSGSGAAPLDAVMAELGHKTVASGGFRGKLGAARMFGFIRTSGMDLTLTDLGRRIVQEDSQARARADAFLRVPLFRALYDQYRGETLPGDSALERQMASLGVTPKQKERARQVFQRSAAQAGFSDAGADKLIAPVFGELPPEPQGESDQKPPPPRASERKVSEQPLIQGLFESLPAPGPWPESARREWLEAAKAIFTLVYKEEPKSLPSGSEPPSERSQNGAQDSEPQP